MLHQILPLTTDLSSLPNGFFEHTDTNLYFSQDAPLSCVSNILLNGIPSTLTPSVCDVCKHYIDCFILENPFHYEPLVDTEEAQTLFAEKPHDV